MTNAFTIARTNLLRMTRDRIGLFFVFVFPVVLILLLGVAFGGGVTPALGVLAQDDGDLARGLVDRLAGTDGVEVRRFRTLDDLTEAVQRGDVQAGVVIPAAYGSTLHSGGVAEVGYLATPGNFSVALRSTVDSAVADRSGLVKAARFAAAESGIGFEDGLRLAGRMRRLAPSVGVEQTVAGEDLGEQGAGQFGLGAASQLVLFMFLNSLAGAAALVQTRRLGVSRRMLSAPVGPSTILAGEGLGRFGIALVQGLFIIAFSALLFGVRWGNPVAAATLVLLFSLVCTGAAMLAGATLRNENQTGALVPVALGLASLGGCMVPLEIFSSTMQKVAHVTPHAWAVEGFTRLIRTDAGLPEILPQLLALSGFALVLLTLATGRLRHAIAG